jgi:protein-L-isoaspartate(D-aspartate) O-methyltransferase
MFPVLDPAHPDRFQAQRSAMVAEQLRNRGIRDERVLQAMEKVPRHVFVPRHLQKIAYDDNPVPVGEAQTVSQPYIVAYMLQTLHTAPEHCVLEIGTGTGYEAALLAELARQVYTIECVPALAVAAKANLEGLGYRNLEVISGDGSVGLPERAPYDRIIVAAAAPEIPEALFEQLAEGGRMILPVGTPEVQELILVWKQNGVAVKEQLEACRFVPLLGEHGFRPH